MASISATTAAIITAVAAVAAAGTSSYAAYSSAENQKEAADYNAKVANNAAIDARNRGMIAADEHRQKVQKLIGTQRAGMAANGLVVDSGTPLNILTETAGTGELDALRLLNNSQREAQGFESQSVLNTMEGKNARQAGQIGVASSLLSGASGAVSSYYGVKGKQ